LVIAVIEIAILKLRFFVHGAFLLLGKHASEKIYSGINAKVSFVLEDESDTYRC